MSNDAFRCCKPVRRLRSTEPTAVARVGQQVGGINAPSDRGLHTSLCGLFRSLLRALLGFLSLAFLGHTRHLLSGQNPTRSLRSVKRNLHEIAFTSAPRRRFARSQSTPPRLRRSRRRRETNASRRVNAWHEPGTRLNARGPALSSTLPPRVTSAGTTLPTTTCRKG